MMAMLVPGKEKGEVEAVEVVVEEEDVSRGQETRVRGVGREREGIESG
jgi:hypothetical protein